MAIITYHFFARNFCVQKLKIIFARYSDCRSLVNEHPAIAVCTSMKSKFSGLQFWQNIYSCCLPNLRDSKKIPALQQFKVIDLGANRKKTGDFLYVFATIRGELKIVISH